MEQASALPQQTQANNKADYYRLIRKSMEVACFLFPVLMVISIVFFLIDDEVRWHGYLYVAWFAGIITMLRVADTLSSLKPKLAFISTVFCFVGGVSQAIADRVEMEWQMLVQLAYDVSYDTTMEVFPEIAYFAITVLLFMIGAVMLGVGILQTGVFPRLAGVMLIAAPIGFFLHQGPGVFISEDIPEPAFFLSAVCYAIGGMSIAWHIRKT